MTSVSMDDDYQVGNEKWLTGLSTFSSLSPSKLLAAIYHPCVLPNLKVKKLGYCLLP